METVQNPAQTDLQGKPFAVFVERFQECGRLLVQELIQIFMGRKAVVRQLDHRHRHVRAVITHALEGCEQIVEHEALLDRALALLEPFDVAALHLVAELVDQLLQGLDLHGKGQIVFDERLHRQTHDLPDRHADNGQLLLRFLREGDLLFVQLLRALGNVHRVIGDALKIRDGVQIFRHILILLLGELPSGQFYKVGAQRILVAVAVGFQLLHPGKIRF